MRPRTATKGSKAGICVSPPRETEGGFFVSASSASSIDRKSLEILERSEEWLGQFHEIASDSCGDRDRHLRQRHCIEEADSWDTRESEWECRQAQFLQAPIDVGIKLDRLLPDVRSIAPTLADMLKSARDSLVNLRDAIQEYEVKPATAETCREWFTRNRNQYLQLKDGAAQWVVCSSCRRGIFDYKRFDFHFREFRHSGVWPCGHAIFDSDTFEDDQTISRHVERCHSVRRRTSEPLYHETVAQHAILEEAGQRCCQLYQEAARQILCEKLSVVKDTGSDVPWPLMNGALKEVRDWLDEFHRFAADEGGKRARHLSKRSFRNLRDRIYGEKSEEWNEISREFGRTGRSLDSGLDRVLATATFVAPDVVTRLENARKGLSDLRRAIAEPKTDQEAYDCWRKSAELAFYLTGDQIAQDCPELEGIAGAACPLCYESFVDGSKMLDHFFDEYSAPSPNSRVLMSPKEHVQTVEKEAESCRRFYMEAVEALRHSKGPTVQNHESDESVASPALGTREWRIQNARKAANARHDREGGSRDKKAQIREIWAKGNYSTKDICAEQECAALDWSFSAARKALYNQPDRRSS